MSYRPHLSRLSIKHRPLTGKHQASMRILLIHQNFPGQCRHLAQAWAYRPDQQVGIGRDRVIGSHTASVEEAIQHGRIGLLTT